MNDPEQRQRPLPLARLEGWWRWPLVPFAAYLGAFLGSALLGGLHWLSMKFHGGMSEDGWLFLYVLPLFQSVAFGYLYSYIACAVAPRSKSITGWVMISVLALATLVALFLVWGHQPNAPLGSSILVTAQMLLALAAAAQFVLTRRREHGAA